MEPQGNQEFLEAKFNVTVSGNQLEQQGCDECLIPTASTDSTDCFGFVGHPLRHWRLWDDHWRLWKSCWAAGHGGGHPRLVVLSPFGRGVKLNKYEGNNSRRIDGRG